MSRDRILHAHPRPTHLVETALYCDDLPVTAAFYERLLGAEPILRTDRVVAFDAGRATVLLCFQRGESSKPLPTEGGTVPGHHSDGPAHFAFAIAREDVPAWEAHLAQLGIAVESRVDWPRGGHSIYFRDPDGRSVELATPGVWSTY